MKTRPVTLPRPPARLLLVLTLAMALATGCGWLASLRGPEAGTITFANGELTSLEPHTLETLDVGSERAIQAMGYEAAEVTREEGRVHWRARSASGDTVDIRLATQDEKTTELRIRVGVLGDEARSRLLLEQIHQSL